MIAPRGLGAVPPVLVALLALTGCASSSAPRQARSAPADAPLPLAEPAPAAITAGGEVYQHGVAAYYADSLAGRSTASGEPYDPTALTAAHRTLPLGAVVDVARADGRHVTVRINDRGPYARGRIIDLSRSAAREIGLVADGTASVLLRVLTLPPPRARRRRR